MKKFENILIASDIDGTILWNASYINPRNFEKLRYFCDNGGHFALSTGRNHKDIFAVMSDLRDYVNMPCILCNGSFLYDIEKNEILNPQYLNNEKFVALARRIREMFAGKAGIRASFADGFLVADDDDVILEQLKGWNLEKLAIIRPFEDFSREKLFKAVCLPESEIISSIREMAEKEFSEYFTFTTSDAHIFEIQPLGVSKNFQFPYLKKMYNDAELWCIGDYDNDLEMLRGADVAICPENAVDSVKAISKYMVCHCKDGALADMIDLIESVVCK
jgi:Cof subfamily protein (haloacid dehalogenase superfamily)